MARTATSSAHATQIDRHLSLEVCKIGPRDLREALASGFDDFMAKPSHLIFICIIYPIVGLILSRLAFGYDVLPLIYPLVAGFVLLGPLAAVGLYEISRRREAGDEVSWSHALNVLRSPGIGAVFLLGALLVVIFFAWLVTANMIYVQTFGAHAPASLSAFINAVMTTPAGMTLMVLGNGIGFVFAVIVLAISVVSFPLILDRHVDAFTAIRTSVRAVFKNPVTMTLWGLIVALGLALGSLPFFIGLAIAMPVLGHATWHLYRKVVTV